MPYQIKLPARSNIVETGAADPLKFYYFPISRSFYLGRFSDAVRLLQGKLDRLLEVGCGSGIFLPELSRHCSSLFACDMHSHLTRTHEMMTAESESAFLACSDARFLPFASASMDAIVCMSVLEHLHDLQRPAEEFFRVLRPGGIAVVGVPVTNIVTNTVLRLSYLSLDARLEDEHVSTHQDILRAFGKLFQVEDILHIPRFLPEQLRLYTTLRFKKPEVS